MNLERLRCWFHLKQFLNQMPPQQKVIYCLHKMILERNPKKRKEYERLNSDFRIQFLNQFIFNFGGVQQHFDFLKVVQDFDQQDKKQKKDYQDFFETLCSKKSSWPGGVYKKIPLVLYWIPDIIKLPPLEKYWQGEIADAVLVDNIADLVQKMFTEASAPEQSVSVLARTVLGEASTLLHNKTLASLAQTNTKHEALQAQHEALRQQYESLQAYQTAHQKQSSALRIECDVANKKVHDLQIYCRNQNNSNLYEMDQCRQHIKYLQEAIHSFRQGEQYRTFYNMPPPPGGIQYPRRPPPPQHPPPISQSHFQNEPPMNYNRY